MIRRPSHQRPSSARSTGKNGTQHINRPLPPIADATILMILGVVSFARLLISQLPMSRS